MKRMNFGRKIEFSDKFDRIFITGKIEFGLFKIVKYMIDTLRSATSDRTFYVLKNGDNETIGGINLSRKDIKVKNSLGELLATIEGLYNKPKGNISQDIIIKAYMNEYKPSIEEGIVEKHIWKNTIKN